MANNRDRKRTPRTEQGKENQPPTPPRNDGVLGKLVSLVPKLKTAFQLAGFVVVAGSAVAMRQVEPHQVKGVLATGSVGLFTIVFGQVFANIHKFPPKDRKQVVLGLVFIYSLLFVSGTALAAYFLSQEPPGKPDDAPTHAVQRTTEESTTPEADVFREVKPEPTPTPAPPPTRPPVEVTAPARPKPPIAAMPIAAGRDPPKKPVSPLAFRCQDGGYYATQDAEYLLERTDYDGVTLEVCFGRPIDGQTYRVGDDNCLRFQSSEGELGIDLDAGTRVLPMMAVGRERELLPISTGCTDGEYSRAVRFPQTANRRENEIRSRLLCANKDCPACKSFRLATCGDLYSCVAERWNSEAGCHREAAHSQDAGCWTGGINCPAASSGGTALCVGACENRSRAAEAWCGNCVDHCSGGSEEECALGCQQECERARHEYDWSARCDAAKRKRDDDCRTAPQGPAKGHFCSESGDGWRGNTAAIGHWCSESGDGRQAAARVIADACHGNRLRDCLTACSGLRNSQWSCRSSWCEEGGRDRRACFTQVADGKAACERNCRAAPEGCKNEKCVGVVTMADCKGGKKITGWCVSYTRPQ